MLKVVPQVRFGLRNNAKYPVNKKLKQIRAMFANFDVNTTWYNLNL